VSPQTFFDNFALLAEAPNGVAKLRELIMQLAVRGKLAPQDRNDEPATSLVKRIFHEKLRLARGKTAKGIETSKPIQQDEAPYSLPSTWVWQSVEEVFYPISPSQNKVKSSEVNESGKFPVIDQGKNFIAGYVDDESKLIRIPGPVIIFGDHTCELKLVDFDFVAGADGVKILRPIQVYEPYFFRVVQTFEVAERGYSRHYKFFLDNLFPLAPLEEQKRIVAKVDELMRLCDELEAQQQTRRESRLRLNNATLAPLNNTASLTSEEFEEASGRLADNFPALYESAETVGKLRSTILQLAVHGKLVPHNLNDEPASVLLKKIAAEKEAQLIKKGVKKRDLPFHARSEEMPFNIPTSWQFCYLTEIANKVTDGEHITPERSATGHYLLSARNVLDSGISLVDVDHVPQREFERIRKRCDPDKGDVLISCSGSVGRVAIVDRDNAYVMVRSAALVKPVQKHLDSEFLACVLRSPFIQEQILAKSRVSAQANLFIGKIKELITVLPPLEEQRRIVAKINQLMALCDELEAKLRQAEADSEKLMNAAVQHVLASLSETSKTTLARVSA
jgi:type I restriction enzyme, S subunit